MLTLADINNIETEEDVSDLEYYQSIQRAINAGAWSFQGSYGRTMMDAIKAGRCLLGTAPARDYWGNVIPSRYQVQEQTMGTGYYVADRCGVDWLNAMEAI